MSSLRMAQAIFDILYPVGTYYETSNVNFNPNNDPNWYGTWVQDTKGQTLVSKSDNGTFSTLGSNVGSETHRHDFKIGLPFDYGEVIADSFDSDYFGAYSYSVSKYGKSRTTSEITGLSLFANTNHVQSGSVKNWGRVASSTGDTDTGSSIQPSKVCIRWHRTA